MTFTCIGLETGQRIGTCTLPDGRHDPVGTEHRFGDISYILQAIHIYKDNALMYFALKK